MTITSQRHALLMALPLFAAGNLSHFVVVADRGERVHDRYVVATMVTLNDSEWSHGYYCVNREDALTYAYLKAGMGAMPWDAIAKGRKL